jgi:predicted aldo/keto reductase-like oxidoreductase
MKTQSSEAGIADAWKKFQQVGKWNKFQAVLKAVWADPRITAAVSAMDNFDKLKENVAAALDKHELGLLEKGALHRYAEATRHLACDGCDRHCNAAIGATVRIGDTLRCLMYHDVYGQPEEARARFRRLPAAARSLAGIDFRPANAACPHGVDVARLIERAKRVFAAELEPAPALV